MIPETLDELAKEGASAIVGMMAKDAWAGIRTRVVRFLHRDRQGEDVEHIIDTAAQSVRTQEPEASLEAAAEARGEVRALLRQIMRADPTCVDELRELLVDIQSLESGHSSKKKLTQRQTVVQGIGIQAARDVRYRGSK